MLWYLVFLLSFIGGFLPASAANISPDDAKATLKASASQKCTPQPEPDIFECVLSEKYIKYYAVQKEESDKIVPVAIAELKPICAGAENNEFLLLECVIGVGYTAGDQVVSMEKLLKNSPSCETFIENYTRLWDGPYDLEKVALEPNPTLCSTVGRLTALWKVVPTFEPCGAKANVDEQVAICVAGPPDAQEFRDFWRSASSACASRQPIPRQADLNRAVNEAMGRQGYANPDYSVDCEMVARIAERFGILKAGDEATSGLMIAAGLDPTEPERFANLEKEAEAGSQLARFYLAVNLLSIEKDWTTLWGPRAVVRDRRKKALKHFQILADQGQTTQTLKFLLASRDHFELTPGMDYLLQSKKATYIELLNILGSAGSIDAELELARWAVEALAYDFEKLAYEEVEFRYEQARNRIVAARDRASPADKVRFEGLLTTLAQQEKAADARRFKFEDLLAIAVAIAAVMPDTEPTPSDVAGKSACDRAHDTILELGAYAGPDAAMNYAVGAAWGGC